MLGSPIRRETYDIDDCDNLLIAPLKKEAGICMGSNPGAINPSGDWIPSQRGLMSGSA